MAYPPVAPLTPPRLRVLAGYDASSSQEFWFDRPFVIGRTEGCELLISDHHVSRRHAQVTFESTARGMAWVVRDLQSANGILAKQERVAEAIIDGHLTIRLGVEGPFVRFEVQPVTALPQSPSSPVSYPPQAGVAAPTYASAPATTTVPNVPPSAPTPVAPPMGGSQTQVLKAYADRYLGKNVNDETIGDHTRMIRTVISRQQKKTRWRFAWVLGILVLALAGLGGFAYYQNQELSKRRQMAQDLFYAMKSLDVDIATTQKMLLDSESAAGRDQIRKFTQRREEMSRNYDRFLTSLKIYEGKLSEEDKLILRMARVFGECELDMPPEFASEVKKYIGYWKSTPRFRASVERARSNGYTPKIAEELLNAGLPPQFFYLAMQESGFDAFISGPMTYKGHAKGMWQFIPETGVKYGLKMGPLVDFPRPDPLDDRHNWQKATQAATRYLKDLYATDALASGLLVMASYNWGEHRVIKRIQSMPGNPKERNFWKLLTLYREDLPQETYDYVFYIFSAAVIGENPRLFGFDFDNPLATPNLADR